MRMNSHRRWWEFQLAKISFRHFKFGCTESMFQKFAVRNHLNCTFQTFRNNVFFLRKILFRQRNENCLRRAFQIYREKVFPLQHVQRKQWTKLRKPLLNRLWLLLSQMRRERWIGSNKWGRVPISKLSSRCQGRGGGVRDNNAKQHGNNAEQHEKKAERHLQAVLPTQARTQFQFQAFMSY